MMFLADTNSYRYTHSMAFNPNAAAKKTSGIFGLPHTLENAKLVFLPVPWEATTSYGGGTAQGPAIILKASRQVDLYDLDLGRPYEAGMYTLPESQKVISMNKNAKALASKIIAATGDIENNPDLQKALQQVNTLSFELNQWVYTETKKLLAAQKLVGILGGEHSVPFGALKALSEAYPSFGVLHFDAHSDTRKAFEGFTHSHASIYYNVLNEIPAVSKLIQVGIRDFCEEELEFCRSQKNRVQIFFDRDLSRKKFQGITWQKISKEIIHPLPEMVWISFDIDGLDPKLCPSTGTPVPGGLDYNEACFLIAEVTQSGRKIIGFDLCEVAPHPTGQCEWDANVGARLLYQLASWCLKSHQRL